MTVKIRAGWDVILVDNVIDTGTTARAAMQAMELSDAECGVFAIGNTGAWKNF